MGLHIDLVIEASQQQERHMHAIRGGERFKQGYFRVLVYMEDDEVEMFWPESFWQVEGVGSKWGLIQKPQCLQLNQGWSYELQRPKVVHSTPLIGKLQYCRGLLPVGDCHCKICSTKKGFCSKCMCPVCLNFDCASNTCSWVGRDSCSHWCHAVCGIRRNLIKPGPSLKGPSGTTEMQFNCLGCGHASEMFGFVKNVLMSCAKEWGEETLMKELDCVRKIFQGSEDLKGKELHVKAAVLHTKLVTKMISPSDACNFFFQFFSGSDGLSDFSYSNFPATDLPASLRKHAVTGLPASTSLIIKSSFYDVSSSSRRQDMMPADHCPNDVNASFMSTKTIEDERFLKPSKKDEVYGLGSIVRIKEAEALMFQSLADDARREAGSFRRLVRLKSEKLQEEYSEKLSKLCLQETEEKRRKKLEELKALENSHRDYMRIHMEIAGMLRRMEAAKQPLAAMTCRTFLLLIS